MTLMLALVRGSDDVAAAIAGGADRVLVRLSGISGEDATTHLRAIAAAARGRCPVSVWRSLDALALSEACAASGADEVWEDLGTNPQGAIGRWAVMAPGDTAVLSRAAAQGVVGVVVDGHDGPRHLLATVTIQQLEAQARAARGLGLRFAVAGAIEAPDVPRLMALRPDALVFGDFLRRDGRQDAPLAPERVRLVRDLIHAGAAPDRSGPQASREAEPDRIFVRDWIVPLHLGAYGHETEAQRVRFTVEAEVTRVTGRAADMRDVVTYDLITDAIARATVAHVALVETIAEDVAALILAHPRVTGVDVTVEKLDLGPGSLGCRIKRRRAG